MDRVVITLAALALGAGACTPATPAADAGCEGAACDPTDAGCDGGTCEPRCDAGGCDFLDGGCDGADCEPPDAGPCNADAGCGLAGAFASGTWTFSVTERPASGILKLRLAGADTVTLEFARDATAAMSWSLVRTRPDGTVRWRVDAPAADRFTDFAIHPEGDVTLALEHTALAEHAYALHRFSPDGELRASLAIPAPSTVPAADLPETLPADPFLLKSLYRNVVAEVPDDPFKIEAHGDDLRVAFVSIVRGSTSRFLTGVMALEWTGTGFTQQWARVVDGSHGGPEVQWSYDEFRWIGAMERPLLAVSAGGGVVVGRTFGMPRCEAARETFGEFDVLACILLTSGGDAHRYQPFALTLFAADGARLGTTVFPPAPKLDPVAGLQPYRFDQFVVFGLAVDGDDAAIAGAAVLRQPDGGVAYYAGTPGAAAVMDPYDGYLAVLPLDGGTPRLEQFIDPVARGDLLADVRWAPEGWIAAGAGGWDRWNGGMSLSRGASPLWLFAPHDGGTPVLQRRDGASAVRHTQLFSLDHGAGRVVAGGLDDAPMTHSGDNGQLQELSFGGLRFEAATR